MVVQTVLKAVDPIYASMMSWNKNIGRMRLFSPAVRAMRFWKVTSSARADHGRALRWALTSKEWTNFTYELSERNRAQLAETIALVLGTDHQSVLGWFEELESDAALREHVEIATKASAERATSDVAARYGGRLGWYALVRGLGPRLVVESGVDKGLGACVLALALAKNAEEGRPGRYIGLELRESKAWMFTEPFTRLGEVRFGDAVSLLSELDDPVDLYLSETAAGADLEKREYHAVSDLLSEDSVVVGAMAHATDELMAFAHRTGRRAVFFSEDPADHPFDGAVHGYAFRPTIRRNEQENGEPGIG